MKNQTKTEIFYEGKMLKSEEIFFEMIEIERKEEVTDMSDLVAIAEIDMEMIVENVTEKATGNIEIEVEVLTNTVKRIDVVGKGTGKGRTTVDIETETDTKDSDYSFCPAFFNRIVNVTHFSNFNYTIV